MRSSSRSFASGDETPHAHETWCVRKAANTSAGELSAGSSTIPPLRHPLRSSMWREQCK